MVNEIISIMYLIVKYQLGTTTTAN